MENDIFQRYEIKFLADSRQRADLEQAIRAHMLPDPYGESTICNIYYDTPDYRLIRESLEKPEYKEKLRMRSYGPVTSDGQVFLELKKKHDGIVYKRRISLPEWRAAAGMAGRMPLPEDSQIGREIRYFCRFYGELRPAVYLSYDRSAYFSTADPGLRATFDKNIRWRTTEMRLTSAPRGERLLAPQQSLLEVKTPGALPLWLVEALNQAEIRQTSFSKYGEAYKAIMEQTYQERRGVFCA